MKQDLKSRIQRMYMQDCAMAYVDALLLWASTIFVLVSISNIVEDGNIRAVMIVSCLLLLLFNTASVFAMTKHFYDDKHFIYGLDIKHLDENRSIAAYKLAAPLPVAK
jgi:hypothetical protein